MDKKEKLTKAQEYILKMLSLRPMRPYGQYVHTFAALERRGLIKRIDKEGHYDLVKKEKMMEQSKEYYAEGVHIYANGILHCSVCAPSDMSLEAVEAFVNLRNPTGISSRWSLSENPTFASGEPNPKPCEMEPGRTHYLMSC